MNAQQVFTFLSQEKKLLIIKGVNKMECVIFALLAISCLWGIANEEKLIDFEQKCLKYIKAFFKVLKQEVFK